MKIIRYLSENILFLLTLFLLVFIPLYPKLPLLDIKHTWVYIRIEDFIIAVVWIIFLIKFFKKKATLKTPLTLPIIIFWIVGALATIHGILFVFPKLEGVFPSIALLHYLRRIEYLSLFFLSYAAFRKKSLVTPLIATLSLTLLVVFFYGLGQRFWGLPAFLTMNEEFAKGIPLKLSPLARIPSTFAGHYDLAAYLILMIPLMGSMIFGYKKWLVKIFFFLTATAGLILLMMTASRVSFVVYLFSIAFMLILQRKKLFIIPVFILSFILLQSFQGLSQRLASTFTQVDLVVDSRTGKPIGVASEFGGNQIVIEDRQSTGENLPQGSKYINIPSSSGKKISSDIVYKKLKSDGTQEEIITRSGDVIVKKAFAYDVSFTTRFQGEWPRAIEAFKRNILLGSGYSSISLATDNNYLRILGETGILGLISFLGIFLIAVIYLWRLLPAITDNTLRSFVLGMIAGVFGLSLNAILIDVFDASKVAFVLWMLVGATLSLVKNFENKSVNYYYELKRIFFSTPAYIAYLIIFAFLIFGPSLKNYFAGDDFTWLRWAADCPKIEQGSEVRCESAVKTITSYFLNSEGFFYRPGTKTYFYLMYPLFELFPAPFHLVSLILHIISAILLFFLVLRWLGNKIFAFLAGIFFLVLSTHGEAVYWISVTGHMIAWTLTLLALLCYTYWKENKNIILFGLSWIAIVISTFFHEFGFTGSILLIAYDLIVDRKNLRMVWKRKWYYIFLLLPIAIYFYMRTISNSLWFQGDYNYNLLKLPFNTLGNLVGYLLLSLLGPTAYHSIYTPLRTFTAENIFIASLLLILGGMLTIILIKKMRKYLQKELTGTMILISCALFVIPLLPFVGLGNITTRYPYLASSGVVIFMITVFYHLFMNVKPKNKTIIAGIFFVIAILFVAFHIHSLQKVNNDWQKAGEITRTTLVEINKAYAQKGHPKKQKNQKEIFYFVNVPIRYGEAWVFPVGLQDALWFSFQNVDLEVHNALSEEEALAELKRNPNIRIFTFLKDGSLVEIQQAK